MKFKNIKSKGFTLVELLIGITISLILSLGGLYTGLEQLDSFKKDGDKSRISTISNSIMSSINRDGDLNITCSDGTSTGCIINDGGVYNGCSMTGANISSYNSIKGNLDNISFGSGGNVVNIKDFNYILCPKIATGYAFSGTFVNPSFILKGWNNEIKQSMNFNP